MAAFCAQNTFINANPDVFAGLVAWGAGSFSTSYLLSLTPSNQDSRPVDTALMRQCLLAPWNTAPDGDGAIPTPTSAGPGPTPTTASTVLVLTLTPATLSTPTALLTASQNLPIASTLSDSGSSSSTSSRTSSSKSSKPTTHTSNILILTDVLSQSTATTLEIATGTPPSRSGFGGLFTAADPGAPSPTPSAFATPSGPADGAGAGSVAVGALTLWGCVLIAAASLV
ncbi:hypothetical protein F5B18DRAFT_439438 [Nemania serpens]|nr:hypothetical protein F5B18DRAFT_439438 [Nemania serpens]